MIRRRAFTAAVCCSLLGCSLIVGTDDRVVGRATDGGHDQDVRVTVDASPMKDSSPTPDAAPDCSGVKACVNAQNQCDANCTTDHDGCESNCHGGPKGDQCRQDCQSALQACTSGCGTNCSSCAASLHCAPNGCHS